MSTFDDIQNKLDEMLPMPNNLPIVYLIGDTGAGKTCLIRQLLGTSQDKFPSVRRQRTTVAPTEFIVAMEPVFQAAFVLKSEKEVLQFLTEILEQAVTTAVDAEVEHADVTEALGDSPDQRFRLRCFLNRDARQKLGDDVSLSLAQKVKSKLENDFPDEPDRSTAIELILEYPEIREEFERIRSDVMSTIRGQVIAVCGDGHCDSWLETFTFKAKGKAEFIQKLKRLLSVDEGSISPIVAKARVRGRIKSHLIPDDTEIVLIDGEGIGHDARESRILSARHLDYFNISDAIVLVEDSEKPFTGGGKSVLSSVAKTGYLSSFHLAFSRLDKVEADDDGRESQKWEVDKNLRNAVHALREEGEHLQVSDLRCLYLANMDKAEPDEQSCEELTSLVRSISSRFQSTKARFVAPTYDFELLSGHLVGATAALRQAWESYIKKGGIEEVSWQAQKAFTVRMSWQEDEYKVLKPVAEFTALLMTSLQPFLMNPERWEDEITASHKKDCLDRLTQAASQEVLRFVRRATLFERQPEWQSAADLRGKDTTPIRRTMILNAIQKSAPELIGMNAKKFKDAMKQVIQTAISACQNCEMTPGIAQ